MLGASNVDDFIGTRVSSLATLVGGHCHRGVEWFDGFWDFFVDHRDQLETAWGISSGKPGEGEWALIFILPRANSGTLQVEFFFESKDYRPGVIAPWPVSTIVLGGEEPASVGARDRFDRPHRVDLADGLRARGFDVFVGYWGVRVSRTVAPEEVAQSLDPLFETLPEALEVALRLGQSLT